MMNVEEKYLPVGTVVMLKGGSKRLMITGFCITPQENTAQMFDYSGCLYPEGIINTTQNAVFNHDQIAQVYHLGLKDEEEKLFKEKLNNLLIQRNNQNNISNQ